MGRWGDGEMGRWGAQRDGETERRGAETGDDERRAERRRDGETERRRDEETRDDGEMKSLSKI